VSSLLKQFSAELATEAGIFLTLLIKLVSSEAKAGESQPSWMRVLAMEIMYECISFFSSLGQGLSMIIRHLYARMTHAGSADMPSSCVVSGNAGLPV
jgi:hypothetical protein